MGDVGNFLKRALWSDEQTMSCDPQTFTGIDQATHERLLNYASANGVEFNGNTAKFKGLEFSWEYDVATETEIITCTKRPLLVSCGTVFSHINKIVLLGKGDSL